MKTTIDIVSAIIAAMVSTVTVDTVGAPVSGVFTVTSSGTSWLCMNLQLSIEGSAYRVVEIVQNVSFNLKQKGHTNVISGDDFNIAPPTFFKGTWKMMSQERDNVTPYKDKTPFIWLYDVREESIKLDLKSSVDRDADLRLFFMAEANFGDWLTTDHYDQVINPLKVLVRDWLWSARISRYVSKSMDGDMRTKDHANAGSVDKDGHLKALFNEELSGIEATLTLPINKCST